MVVHQGTKILKTNRLTLRPFVLSDAEDVFRNWAGDSAVTRFLTWDPHEAVDVTYGVLKEWEAGYEKPDHYMWAIVLGADNVAVGSIGLQTEADSSMAEAGYCLSRSLWGRGIMTEALRAVIGFGLQEVMLDAVYARHHVDNPASGWVMEKSGMLYMGRKRSQMRPDKPERVVFDYYAARRTDWLGPESCGV